MKLIFEELNEKLDYITEDREDGKKAMYIRGPFMQYNNDRFTEPNRNGRIYPEQVMRKEVDRYISEAVNQKRAYGELNHPSGPTINLDRVSHIIETLEFGKDGRVYGKAKIFDTPMGNTVRGLIEGGANLGVSTRGLGSLQEGKSGIMEVQDDFRLVTAADIVAEPSAQAAFVRGVMENVEWFISEDTGEWVRVAQKKIHKMSKTELEEKKALFFESFLKTL